MTPAETRDGDFGPRGRKWLAGSVRFFIAPLILFVGGFFTTDFAISGRYTWPQTSRALALTLTVAILAYEFVYKEQLARGGDVSVRSALKAVVYSCLVPYALGVIALITLARM